MLPKGSCPKKRTLLDRLTGYHHKSAVRLLRTKPARESLLFVDGKPVKLKPDKKHPPNRKGKRLYADGSSLPSARSGPSSGSNAAGNEVSPDTRPLH
jgi:ribosomal protein L32